MARAAGRGSGCAGSAERTSRLNDPPGRGAAASRPPLRTRARGRASGAHDETVFVLALVVACGSVATVSGHRAAPVVGPRTSPSATTPPTLVACRRTDRRPASRSTSPYRSPSSSPRRRPAIAARRTSAPSSWSATASRNVRSSAGVTWPSPELGLRSPTVESRGRRRCGQPGPCVLHQRALGAGSCARSARCGRSGRRARRGDRGKQLRVHVVEVGRAVALGACPRRSSAGHAGADCPGSWRPCSAGGPMRRVRRTTCRDTRRRSSSWARRSSPRCTVPRSSVSAACASLRVRKPLSVYLPT